jgi:GxxExxY protein
MWEMFLFRFLLEWRGVGFFDRIAGFTGFIVFNFNHKYFYFMEYQDLTKEIIAGAFAVHNSLGSGFLEKVYENSLLIELRERGFDVEQQVPISVFYKNKLVGDYMADLLVNKTVILELKAVENLQVIHETQLVNYLTATGLDIGLLINFGSSAVVKRKYRVYSAKI